MARNPVTRIIITAKDEASAVFSGLRAHAGKIATAIAGYFGARMFGDVVGAARDFESAMSAVQAAAGASGDELAKLRAAAEQAGAEEVAVESADAPASAPVSLFPVPARRRVEMRRHGHTLTRRETRRSHRRRRYGRSI